MGVGLLEGKGCFGGTWEEACNTVSFRCLWVGNGIQAADIKQDRSKMQRTELSELLKLLSTTSPTQKDLLKALSWTDQQLSESFPRGDIIRTAKSLRPQLNTLCQSTLTLIQNQHRNMYLLYSTQQLMLLLSVCLQANAIDIFEIALTYTQRLFETIHLQVFRKVAGQVLFEQYNILVYFNGMLSFLVPSLLRNGQMIKILRVLAKTVGRELDIKSDARALTEMMFVEAVARRLDEESLKGFMEFIRKICKKKLPVHLGNLNNLMNSEKIICLDNISILRFSEDSLDKADLKINTQQKTMQLVESKTKPWPTWVQSSYSFPKPIDLSDFKGKSLAQVYRSFQYLMLWASSPEISDPSEYLDEKSTDIFIKMITGVKLTTQQYKFKMEKWKQVLKNIAECSAQLGQKDRVVMKKDLNLLG